MWPRPPATGLRGCNAETGQRFPWRDIQAPEKPATLSGKNHRRLGGIRHDRSVRDCQMPRAIIDKPAFVQIIAAGLECSQGDPAQVFRIGQCVSHDILEVGKSHRTGR